MHTADCSCVNLPLTQIDLRCLCRTPAQKDRIEDLIITKRTCVHFILHHTVQGSVPFPLSPVKISVIPQRTILAILPALTVVKIVLEFPFIQKQRILTVISPCPIIGVGVKLPLVHHLLLRII